MTLLGDILSSKLKESRQGLRKKRSRFVIRVNHIYFTAKLYTNTLHEQLVWRKKKHHLSGNLVIVESSPSILEDSEEPLGLAFISQYKFGE